MPTLSKTKKETKLILKWGGISLLIIFLFMTGIRITALIKEGLTPPPPPKASFGKLTPIPFPNQKKEIISYTLDTLTGFLPGFKDRANVYRVGTLPPNLLSLDKTQERVSAIGFNSSGFPIAPDVYQWVEGEPPLQRRVTINIFSGDFTLSSSYLIATSLQSFGENENKETAIELSKSFLSRMELFPEDVDEQKTKTSFYTIQNNSLVKTDEISDAKIIRVDFFQKDLNEFPIYYERGLFSTISTLVAKEENEFKIVDVRFFYKGASKDFSDYSIKSASQAFEELKEGKGYIASNSQNLVSIVIKKAILGYYIGENQQEYLMPIIIFEGDNDFVAYVSAVRDEWINN